MLADRVVVIADWGKPDMAALDAQLIQQQHVAGAVPPLRVGHAGTDSTPQMAVHLGAARSCWGVLLMVLFSLWHN